MRAAFPSCEMQHRLRPLYRTLLSRITVVAALITGALLWAAPISFACSGGPSAVNVYTECLPTGGGAKPTSPSQPTETGNSQNVVTPTVPSRTAKALKHAGKDSGVLSALVHHYAPARPLQNGTSQSATAPSLLSSVFDLGSGPAALLIALAATSLLLLARSLRE